MYGIFAPPTSVGLGLGRRAEIRAAGEEKAAFSLANLGSNKYFCDPRPNFGKCMAFLRPPDLSGPRAAAEITEADREKTAFGLAKLASEKILFRGLKKFLLRPQA